AACANRAARHRAPFGPPPAAARRPPPRAGAALGRTVADLRFRGRAGATAAGTAREAEPVQGCRRDAPLFRLCGGGRGEARSASWRSAGTRARGIPCGVPVAGATSAPRRRDDGEGPALLAGAGEAALRVAV